MQSLIRTHTFAALIAFLVLVVSAVALSLFAVSMGKREARVIEARDRLASFEQNKRIFAEEAKELEAIKEHIEQLEAKVVTEEKVPELLSSLEAMAKVQAVEFTITAVSSDAEVQKTARLHIDVSATGTLPAIQSLVKEMLSQDYQIAFTRFSLYQSEEGAGAKAGGWQLLAGVDIISF